MMNYNQNSTFQNVLLGLQARQRMNAMRQYNEDYGTDSSFGSSGSTGKTKGLGSSAESFLENKAAGKISSNATPWVALGLVARNAFEKGTIGGTFGDVHKRMDPFTGTSGTGNLVRAAWKNPLKVVDPSRGGTRVFSTFRAVTKSPNFAKDPSERLFNLVKKIF